MQTQRTRRNGTRDTQRSERNHDERGPGRSDVQVYPGSAGGNAGHGPGRVQTVHRPRDAHRFGSDGRGHANIPARVPGLRMERVQPRRTQPKRVRERL